MKAELDIVRENDAEISELKKRISEMEKNEEKIRTALQEIMKLL